MDLLVEHDIVVDLLVAHRLVLAVDFAGLLDRHQRVVDCSRVHTVRTKVVLRHQIINEKRNANPEMRVCLMVVNAVDGNL